MAKRQTSNPVDRIMGLAYLLGCDALPTYSEAESEENATSRPHTFQKMSDLGSCPIHPRRVLFLGPIMGTGDGHGDDQQNKAKTPT